MKRLLVLFLTGGLCFLGAAVEERPLVPSERIAAISIVPPLLPSEYTRVAMAGGGSIVTYKGTGYTVSSRTIWEHEEGKSGSLTVDFFGEFKDQQFLSLNYHEYRHVKEGPKTPSEWLGVLLERTVVAERRQVNHRYLGEVYMNPVDFRVGNLRLGIVPLPMPWKGRPFKMYENTYRLTVRQLVFWDAVRGQEEIVHKAIVDLAIAKGGNPVNEKKSGLAWQSNPPGQGSAGEEPTNADEMSARFKSLFPEHFA